MVYNIYIYIYIYILYTIYSIYIYIYTNVIQDRVSTIYYIVQLLCTPVNILQCESFQDLVRASNQYVYIPMGTFHWLRSNTAMVTMILVVMVTIVIVAMVILLIVSSLFMAAISSHLWMEILQ